MKFRKHAPVLLLLLPSLATAAAASASVAEKREASIKAAPVDGKDGKPHAGPFVSTDGVADDDLPPLEGRPSDPTVMDGQRIPETNDGVMFDKNRERPQQGTTGTEGGVTEKAKARKAHEERTGGKPEAVPESPKEQPRVPHSQEKKIQAETAAKATYDDDDDNKAYAGLEKPDDLPERTHDQSLPVPDSVNKNHLDLSKGSKSPASPLEADDPEGLIQPFHSFILSLTMILVSEVGDKTFLVAALMAMKHDRIVVFSAAFSALLVMTVLSAVLGHAVPSLIPKKLTSLAAAVLFFVFGGKLLKEGMDMDPNEGVSAELHEVEQELAEKEKELGRTRGGSVSAHALEMGVKGRRSRSTTRFPSPPRSPSQSPVRKSSGGMTSLVQGFSNLCSLLLSPAWVQTFVMTFLGEWGDRSQIATIAMAAGQDYWWVTLGAMCGHAVCTSVAVIGGRAIAGRVSLKVVTVGGAVAFLIFGFIYFIESFYA